MFWLRCNRDRELASFPRQTQSGLEETKDQPREQMAIEPDPERSVIPKR
jgi:hypothetical protein